MDENSCENETSESADGEKAKETENAPQLENVGIKLNLRLKQTGNEDTNHGSSLNDSGPSRVFRPISDDSSPKKTERVLVNVSKTGLRRLVRESQHEVMENTEPITENTQEQTESGISVAENQQQPTENTEGVDCQEVPPLADKTITEDTPTTLPSYEDRHEFQSRVRLAPSVIEHLATRRPSVGPPPSYSFVMKQKKKLKPVPSVDPLVTSTPPPPSYTGSRGMFISPEERICNFPSFADPLWRSHSQPALCPRCGIIVLTTTHTHDSIATHVAALALCLFGCWPCCLIPYCMNVCKNTYHHCPICQTFLGLYKPW